MRRFVIYLIMSALFLGQGLSVAAAVCHHRDAHEHSMALESRNVTVATVAKSEDTAASVVEKKGALSGASSLYSTVADLSPAWMSAGPIKKARALAWPSSDTLAREGKATQPLLRPPLA